MPIICAGHYSTGLLRNLAKISPDINEATKEKPEVVARYIVFMAVPPEQSSGVFIIDRTQKGILELSGEDIVVVLASGYEVSHFMIEDRMNNGNVW
jgi:hypothetical protein